MGFGGATAAMIASLKNNNRMKTRTPFNGTGTYSKKSDGIKSKPISEEALAETRRKIIKEQRNLTIKRRLVLFLIIGLLLILPYVYKSLN